MCVHVHVCNGTWSILSKVYSGAAHVYVSVHCYKMALPIIMSFLQPCDTHMLRQKTNFEAVSIVLQPPLKKKGWFNLCDWICDNRPHF